MYYKCATMVKGLQRIANMSSLAVLLVPSEDHEQWIVARWLDKEGILFYHIPNGGKRDKREAAKFKRTGVKAGIPDICIPIPKKQYHGLYGELKRRRGGKLSDKQRYWIDTLSGQGYFTFVAKGADEFIKFVKYYMEIIDDEQGSR